MAQERPTATLEALDALTVETLVLLVPSDVRPPGGAFGSVDWRLDGRLTALLRSGQFGGGPDEALLLPTHGAFPFGRVLLLGTGTKALTPEGWRRVASRIKALGGKGWALWPGPDGSATPPPEALEGLSKPEVLFSA